MKVYLAGGIRTEWRDKIKKSVNADFYDPTVNTDLDLKQYGTWDLHAVKTCNIVFCYMASSNPSGIGLAVEMGYGKALGKTVILCVEYPNQYIKQQHLNFLEVVSDCVFGDLDEAIEFLKLFK